MPPGPTSVRTVSDVYTAHDLSSRLETFWGWLLAATAAWEVLGSAARWPTITGSLASLLNLAYETPSAFRVLGVLSVQIILIVGAGFFLWQTNWPAWMGARARASAQLLPDVRMRQTLLGVLLGLVVAGFLSWAFGQATPVRGVIGWSELVLTALAVLAAVIAIENPPRLQYQISGHAKAFTRLTSVAAPTELQLEANAFQKAVVLRDLGDEFVVIDTRQSLRIDQCEYILIDVAVLEEELGSAAGAARRVTVGSANVFQCTGVFGLETRPLPPGTRLPRTSVEGLFNNLFAKPAAERIEILTERLNHAMNEYAGEHDASLKSAIEQVDEELLLVEAKASRGYIEGGTGHAQAIRGDIRAVGLDVTISLIERVKKIIKDFRAKWQVARTLQVNAKAALPKAFAAHVQQRFEGDAPDPAVAALLAAAQPVFRVNTFDFTERAAKVEQKASAIIATLTAELKKAREQLEADVQARNERREAVLTGILANFRAGSVTTASGRAMFVQLHALLAEHGRDWMTAAQRADAERMEREHGQADGPAKAPPGISILPAPDVEEPA